MMRDNSYLIGNKFAKDLTPWNKGKKLSEEHKRKLSEVHRGKPTWNKGKKGIQIAWNKGLKGFHHTVETKRKISEKLKGEKSHLWKGGKETEKERKCISENKRRVKKLGNGGSHTFADWQTLKAQYNWTCPVCKRKEPEIKLTHDHIIPISKGGSDNIENIQPLCGSCNSKKHDKIIIFTLISANA